MTNAAASPAATLPAHLLGPRVRKSFEFNLKQSEDDVEGIIEGYASVFNVTDSYGDVIAPGAFSRTISAWKAKNVPVPVLWQHDAYAPIGATLSLEEDERGLKIKAELVMEVEQAREAWALAKKRILGGLSIGFSLPRLAADGQPSVYYDDENDVTVIREVKLWEYSMVTFPANEEAIIDQVRSSAIPLAAPAWAEALTAAVAELRAALDTRGESREIIATLRDLRSMLVSTVRGSAPHAPPSEVDAALTAVLADAKALLRRTS